MQSLVLGSSPAWKKVVYIPNKLRFRHLYLVGKSGKGKSNLLHRLIHVDAKGPYATVVFDAGDLAEDVFEALPHACLRRVMFFSIEHPIPYNPFLRRPDEPDRLPNELFALIDQVTAELSTTAPLSARMKRLLLVAIAEILKTPAPTFSTLATYLLEHKAALRRALDLREDEFLATWEGVLDRLAQFLRDRRIRRVICAGHELDFGRVLDEGKILIVSLAGLEPTLKRFLGTILFHGLQSTIFERKKKDRRPAAIYVDEFHDYLGTSYATETFQTIFSQGRRFQAGITVAHTDFGQVPARLLQTIQGTATSLLAFACGPEEARRMSEVFANEWPPHAVATLPDYEVIVRIDEEIHHLRTYPPLTAVRRTVDKRVVHDDDPPDPFATALRTHDRRDAYTGARRPRGPKQAPPEA